MSTISRYYDAIDDLHNDQGLHRGSCPLCGLLLDVQIVQMPGGRILLEPCCAGNCNRLKIEAKIDEILSSRHALYGPPPAVEEKAPHPVEAFPTNGKHPPRKADQPVQMVRFPLIDLDELCALPPPEWQVEDLFQEESFIQIYGQTGHTKSLFALDLALNMAKGSETWFGRRILKPGPVVWINADGGRGLTDRVNAWKEANGSEFKYRFRTLMGSVHLQRPEHTGGLREQLLEEMDPRPVLIVFDTLSRCIPGADENSQAEMTKVTEACHRIKMALGCTVCLIHHTDKTGQWDRGSSIVKSETDTQIRITLDEDRGISTVHCCKSREGVRFPDFHFRLHPVGSSVVILAEDAPPPETPAERKEAAIEEVMLCIEEKPGITREKIALLLNLAQTNVKRHVNWLLMEGRILEADLPREPGHRGSAGRGLFPAPGI